MNIVPRQQTRIGKEELLAALRNEDLPEPALPLLAALVWIETGAGVKCQNFNVGNITASESYSGSAWRPPWYELSADASSRDIALHEAMQKGQAPRAFRAYGSLSAGVHDFAAVLHRSFPGVISAAEAGDPDAFRVELSRAYSRNYLNTASTATLKTFQAQFGGHPKGPAGAPSSSPSLFPAPLPTLRLGASGDAVRALCRLLGIQVVSLYDGSVEQAVRAYQAAKRLGADGVAGPKTWGELLR